MLGIKEIKKNVYHKTLNPNTEIKKMSILKP
jgi:hypothetical protein